jgi:hypothetical protein
LRIDVGVTPEPIDLRLPTGDLTHLCNTILVHFRLEP